MEKRKVILGLLMFCFGGLAVYGQSSPLKTEIKLAQTTIKNNEEFTVSTAILNTGSTEQSLQVLSCCYSTQWTADNPLVHVDCAESCIKNIPWKVTLKPGQAYEKAVLVRVDLLPGNRQSEMVTFRLGFEDMAYAMAQKIPRIWSNAITVSVTNDGTSGVGSATGKNTQPVDAGSGTGGVTITSVCETTSYQYPKPPGVSASRLIFLEGSQISSTSSALDYNSSSQTFYGTLTIKNISSNTIKGPFQIVLNSLTAGVTLTNSTSTFSCWPYLTVPDVDSLESGQSASVNVQFSNPNGETIKYVSIIYSGSFN